MNLPHRNRHSSAGRQIRHWLRGLLAVISAASASSLAQSGTGALDAGFVPLASELEGRSRFFVTQDACFGYNALLPEIRRYGDDGRWDRIPIVIRDPRPGFTTVIFQAGSTPWGTLWASGVFPPHTVGPQGLEHPIHIAGARSISEMLPLLPLDDGSWVTPDLTQFSPEGVRDSSFARACWLEFGSPNGRPYVQQVIRDHQGRLLAIGNFVKSGAEARLGIVRVLPDGRPDPAFDPAEMLGASVNEEGVLSGAPGSVALGPDGSIFLQASGGTSGRRLAQLDDGGSLIRWIDLPIFGPLLPPVIQPDGRILLGGTFDRWMERPVTSLIRLLPDGSLDESFGVELGNGQSQSWLTGMDLDGRGRLWIHGGFDRVNGVERPGLARLLAYDPPGTPPELRSTASRPRIGTNEVLYLAADVGGVPPPELQWTLDGQPIAGATHRVLRLPVEAGTPLGVFRLVARNADGIQELEFPPVTLGIRSPHAGQLDPDFDIPLGRLPDPQILVPLPDGSLVVTSRSLPTGLENEAMLGRILPDGSWDPGFGDSGVIRGNGVVQAILPLAGGSLLVGGKFTRIAGIEAPGLVELDGSGRPVPKTWPVPEIPEVTALARQPDGKLLIAGLFHRIGGRDTYHLARLDSQGQPDPEFRPALEQGQLVERMECDSEGRIVVAGLRASTDAPFPDFQSLGLQRLLPDGSRDPAFAAGANRWNEFFILPGDSLLVGLPPQHVDGEGGLSGRFDLAEVSVPGAIFAAPLGRSMVPWTGGGVVASAIRRSNSHLELVRWHPDGAGDSTFRCVLGRRFDTPPEVRTMAVTTDGSLVFATSRANAPDLNTAFRLRRLLPDPDTTFGNARLVESRLEATVATQRGATYEIYLRTRLDAATGTRVDGFAGDGYLRTISLPVTPGDNQQFLELVRRRRP